MKALVLILAAALCHCAPKPVVVNPIAPKASIVHESVKAAAAGSKRVQSAVATTHAQAHGIAAKTDALVAETDRLRHLPGIPSAEFDSLWTMATALKHEAWAHEVQARETVVSAAEQERLQSYAEANAEELVADAKTQDEGVLDLKTQLVKQTGNAAIGQAVKGMFATVAIFAVLALVVWGISKLKPRTY